MKTNNKNRTDKILGIIHTTEHKVLPLVSWQLKQEKLASILRGYFTHTHTQKENTNMTRKSMLFLACLNVLLGMWILKSQK